MDERNKIIGIIVLAAGASRRMMQPKQLLEFEGKTLLRRAVETALETNCASVAVVLGANYEKTSAEIEDLNVGICRNENWREGLSSSLKTGLEKLLEINSELDAVIVLLADQPFVSARHLLKFTEKFHDSDVSVIAAEYGAAVGVPALFSKSVFAELAETSGDKGAKMIIEKYRKTLETINLPEAAFDVDTPEDFLKLGA